MTVFCCARIQSLSAGCAYPNKKIRCGCPACSGGFSRAYLRHLAFAGEALGETLLTLHNLHFYQDLMRAMREAIEQDRFADWAAAFRARYLAGRE